MSRINTNVSSLIAQRVLGNQNRALNTSLERLSTGLSINRGKDSPAGLIASEALRSEQRAINAAISNAERAEQVVNVAEGGLQEVNNLLLELQSLVGESANKAGISQAEKDANQVEIDSILQTIDRLANATTFNGSKLLNGDFDYTTSGVAASIEDLEVNSARLSDEPGSYMTVTVDVLSSAQTAGVFLSAQAAGLDNNDNGSITLEVTGNRGVQQFTFASGTSQADMIAGINTFKDALGVSAAQNATDTDRIELRSSEYGSSEFVKVKVLEGVEAGDEMVFASATETTGVSEIKNDGVDASVLVNGVEATTDGLKARVATDGFDVTVNLDGTSALNKDDATTSFHITGGGADFSLSPSVDLAGKVSLGIQTVTTGNLGDSIDGFLSALKSGGTANVVNGDLTKAQSIVDKSISQVSTIRGRLGAFQKNTIQSTINNLGVSLENTSSAESAIRDTDFAAETAELTRRQIMQQAATQSLSIANSQPQAVLALLG